MTKRIIAFVLMISIFASLAVPLCLAEERSMLTLNVEVIKGAEIKYYNIDFLQAGGELYVSCPDIEKITRYKYIAGASNDCAYFSLGDKAVSFSLRNNVVSMPNQNYKGTYAGAIQNNEIYYLPIASVLPWLNCDCDISKERLAFTSDPITYFEITKQFGGLPSVYLGDYLKENEDDFWVLFAANALNNVLNPGESVRRAFVAACNDNNPDYFSYDAYVSVLIDMAADNHAGSEAAGKVFDTFKFVRNVNKITKSFGLDLTQLEVSDEAAQFMAEYGFDASFQTDIADLFDGIKTASILAKSTGGLSPLVKSMTAFEAANNSLQGYEDALEQLINSLPKKSVMRKAAEDAAASIENPFRQVKEQYLKYFVDKVVGKLIDELGDAVVGFGYLDIAAAVAKLIFPNQVKAVSKYSKITVLADIFYAGQDIAKDAKSAMAQKNREYAKNSMLLSALAAKQTLKCISSWKEKIADKKYIEECIEYCDEFIVGLLVCEDTSEIRMTEKTDDGESTVYEEASNVIRKAAAAAAANPVTEAPSELDSEKFKVIASDIDADCIEYFGCESDRYDIFFFSKDKKIGILNKTGDVLLEPIEGILLHVPLGLFLYDNEFAKKDRKSNGYYISENGELEEGFMGGYGGPDDVSQIYWDKKSNKPCFFIFDYWEDVVKYQEFSYEKHSQYVVSTTGFAFVKCINGWSGEGANDFTPNLASEKYAMVNLKTGKFVSDFIYDDYAYTHRICDFYGQTSGARVYLAERDGVWRMIDSKTDYVDSYVYDDPHKSYSSEDEPFPGYKSPAFLEANGYIVIKANGKYGLSDAYGNHVIDPVYRNITLVSYDGMFCIQKDNGKWDMIRMVD